MKIIKKDQTEKIQVSDTCLAIEYPLGDKDINGAVIEINGRYPKEGRTVNLECKEMSYVMKGSGKVVIEGVETLLNEGDLVLIEAKEKFYWEGDLKMFMPCTPAWYPEQHKEVG